MTTKNEDERGPARQRGAAGRPGVGRPRGAGAPERRPAVVLPGGGGAGPAPGPSDGRRARVRRPGRPGRRRSGLALGDGDVVELSGALRRRFYRSRRRDGVAGGGGDDPCPDHPSSSDRMSTPMLGLGWNDVAFSGSSRWPETIRSTRSKSGAGISTATRRRSADAGRGCPRRSGGSRAAAASPGCAGCSSSCSTSTAARCPDEVQLEACPGPAVGDDQRGRPQGRHRGLLAGRGELAPGPRRPSRRRRGGSAASVRWMAPRNRGVSSWSTSIASPVSALVPGRCSCRPQVGRVAVVAVGDQRSGVGEVLAELGQQPGIADRPEPVVALGVVDELVVRRARPSRRGRGRARATGRGAPAGSEPGSAPSRPSGSRELLGLRPVDALVGQHDPVVGIRGSPGDVERADESRGRSDRPRCTRGGRAPGRRRG